MNKILLSIIIPTYNEEKNIGKVLESIKEQKGFNFKYEILIIDGNSTDRTLKIVEEYAGDIPVKILKNDKKKAASGLNIGIKVFKGEYFVRVDAHCLLDKYYFKNIENIIKSNNGNNVFGGQCLIYKKDNLLNKIIRKILKSKYFGFSNEYRTKAEAGEVTTVQNAIYKREVIERTGLFDEKMDFAEDDDYNFRVRGQWKIFYYPELKFYYIPRENFFKLIRQYFNYGYGRSLFFKKHKNIRSVRDLILLSFILYIGIFLYLLFVKPILILILIIFSFIFLLLLSYIEKDDLSFSEKLASIFVLILILKFYFIGLIKGIINKKSFK